MQSTLSPEIALHLHLGVAVAVEMVSSCIGSFVVWLVQASSMMSYTPFNQFFTQMITARAYNAAMVAMKPPWALCATAQGVMSWVIMNRHAKVSFKSSYYKILALQVFTLI